MAGCPSPPPPERSDETDPPFFASPASQRALLLEARGWIGTPFIPFQGVKGRGADCVHLAAGIYQALGVIPDLDFGEYHMRGGELLNESALEAFIVRTGAFVPLDRATQPLRIGDAVTLQMGRVTHHVGVVLDRGRFIHTYRPFAAMEAALDDPTWASRIRGAWRPVRRGGSNQDQRLATEGEPERKERKQ